MPQDRVSQIAADQQLADGLTQNGAAVGTLVIDGKSYTAATIVPVLLGRVAAAKAIEPARTAWQTAVQANRDTRANTGEFVLQVRQALGLAFASDLAMLGKLGISPRKKGVVTPETRVIAATKAKATREARGTAGKKQKARIKGNPPATVTLPVVSAGGAPPPATPTPPVAVPAVTAPAAAPTK